MTFRVDCSFIEKNKHIKNPVIFAVFKTKAGIHFF